MNLLLPYVEGIPPERLSQLRIKMPTAFLDFRQQLHHVVSETVTQGDITYEGLKIKVDRYILPMLRQLESEQKAALTKGKISGIGLSLVSTAAILAGSYLAIPAAGLLASGFTGAAAVVKSIAEMQSAKSKAEGHPFYFLWRAKQG